MSEGEISFSNTEDEIEPEYHSGGMGLGIAGLVEPSRSINSLLVSGPLSDIKLPEIKTLGPEIESNSGDTNLQNFRNQRNADKEDENMNGQGSVKGNRYSNENNSVADHNISSSSSNNNNNNNNNNNRRRGQTRQREKTQLNNNKNNNDHNHNSQDKVNNGKGYNNNNNFQRGDRRRRSQDSSSFSKRCPRTPISLYDPNIIPCNLPCWAQSTYNPHTNSFVYMEGKHTKINNLTRTLPFGPISWAQRLTYRRRKNESKTVLSWKKRGALMEDLEFLICETSRFKNDGTIEFIPSICLYIGASYGETYLPILSSLLPHVVFEVYDPNADPSCDMGENVVLHLEPFTDVTAFHLKEDKRFEEKRFVFISRMRSTNCISMPRMFVEDYIDGDMRAQLRWFEYLLPYAASLKLRFSWEKGTTWYAPGIISYCIYSPPTATDTRMILETDLDEEEHYRGNYRSFIDLCNKLISIDIRDLDVDTDCLSINDNSRQPAFESDLNKEEADKLLYNYILWLKTTVSLRTTVADIKPITKKESDVPILGGIMTNGADSSNGLRQTDNTNNDVDENTSVYKKYDHTVYEENMFYFNTRRRTECYPTIIDALAKQAHDNNDIEEATTLSDWGILDHCYDCSCELRILAGYMYLFSKAKNVEPALFEKVFIDKNPTQLDGIRKNDGDNVISGELLGNNESDTNKTNNGANVSNVERIERIKDALSEKLESNPFDNDNDDIKFDDSEEETNEKVNENGSLQTNKLNNIEIEETDKINKEVHKNSDFGENNFANNQNIKKISRFEVGDIEKYQTPYFMKSILSLSKFISDKLCYLSHLVTLCGSNIVPSGEFGCPTALVNISREVRATKYNFFCLFNENTKDLHKYDGREISINKKGGELFLNIGMTNKDSM